MVTYFSEIWHHSGILRAEVNHSLWREMPPALFGCCFGPPPNLWCRFHSVECYKSQRRACPLLEVRAPRGHCQACHRAGGPVFPGLSSLSFRLSPPPLQSSCSCSASHLPLPRLSSSCLYCLRFFLFCLLSACHSHCLPFLSLPKWFFQRRWSVAQKSSAANVSFSFKGKVCISNWNLIFLHELEAVFFPLRVAQGWSVSHECLRWEVLLACVLEGMLSRGQHSLWLKVGVAVGMGDIWNCDRNKPGQTNAECSRVEVNEMLWPHG